MDNSKPVQRTISQSVEALDQAVGQIHERLDVGDQTMQQLAGQQEDLAAQLKENTESTQRIEAGVGEVIEFLTAMKGAIKVFNWIGSLARPMGAIIGLVIALWGAWETYKSGVRK